MREIRPSPDPCYSIFSPSHLFFLVHFIQISSFIILTNIYWRPTMYQTLWFLSLHWSEPHKFVWCSAQRLTQHSWCKGAQSMCTMACSLCKHVGWCKLCSTDPSWHVWGCSRNPRIFSLETLGISNSILVHRLGSSYSKAALNRKGKT